MKRAVLCEGKTDSIILGLYLGALGWSHLKNGPFKFEIDAPNQTLDWFSHPLRAREELMIWGAGGITRVGSTLSAVVDRTRSDSTPDTRFEKLAIVFDRDDRSDAESLQLFTNWLGSAQIQIKDAEIGKWNLGSVQLRGASHAQHSLSVLPIVVPLKAPGDLEEFLRESLSKMSPADKKLVEDSSAFVDTQPDIPYLPQQRLRSKACLGVILSIISPDWVFGDLDQKLGQVPWAELGAVQAAFAELTAI